MKLSKMISGIFGVLAVIAAAVTVGVTVLALGAKPKLIAAPEEASARVLELMEAVSDGDYSRASHALLGNPSLGADRAPANEVGQLVWDAFVDSFTYTLNGDLYATDNGLAQNVTVSFLDLDSVTTGLQARAQELLDERVRTAETPWDVYTEKYEYREDVVMLVLHEAIEEAMEQRARTTSVDLTLNLVYQNEAWWVSPDSDLLNAISGNILY